MKMETIKVLDAESIIGGRLSCESLRDSLECHEILAEDACHNQYVPIDEVVGVVEIHYDMHREELDFTGTEYGDQLEVLNTMRELLETLRDLTDAKALGADLVKFSPITRDRF